MFTTPKLDAATELVRSSHARVVVEGAQAVAYHTLLGRPLIGAAAIGDLLDEFEEPATVEEVAERLSFDAQGLMRVIEPYVERSLLIRPNTDERLPLLKYQDDLEQRVRDDEMRLGLTLILTKHCNFDCPHCMSNKIVETEEALTGQPAVMSWETAKSAVDDTLKALIAKGRTEAEIAFNGGEILLNWKVMRRVLEYSTEAYPELSLSFAANSNVALVTDEIAAILARYKVSITTSLDGDAMANDAVRVDHAGRGTFDRILQGLATLSKHGVRLGAVGATLVDGNFDKLDARFLDLVASLGINTVKIEPDIIQAVQRPVAEIADKLMFLVEAGEARGVKVGGQWKRPFGQLLGDIHRSRDLASCSAMLGRGYTIQPSGQVHTCAFTSAGLGHYTDWDAIRTSDNYLSMLRSRWAGGIETCRDCQIEGLCKGGCFVTHDYHRQTERGLTSSGGLVPLRSLIRKPEPAVEIDPIGYRCGLYRTMTDALLARHLRNLAAARNRQWTSIKDASSTIS